MPSASELSALTRLFSSAVFQEMAKKGRSALFKRLLEQTGVVERCSSDATVGAVFDAAFKMLRTSGLRDEYIYRAAIIKKILMGKHSLHTASMLTEFRAGNCKADLVILNGTATVYEIKSERDSLYRLENQIENYKRVFSSVNVIVSENHIESVRRIVSDDIGIMYLSKNYTIKIIQEALVNLKNICPVTVLESLRSAEAISILKALGITVPNVPNTQRHALLRELFSELDPAMLHREFVHTLKQTRTLAPLSDLVAQLPVSLHAAALSIPVRRANHYRLIEAVVTPLSAAMAWT